MKIPMADGGVPFVVTYRKILRKPKIKRERKFVGLTQLVKNLVVKAIETVEAAAFETTTEYLDPGQSVAVHWAVAIEDPMDTRPGMSKNLVAYRMEEDIPPNGLHFEVFMAQPKQQAEMSPEQHQQQQREQGPQTNLATDLSPEQFTRLRQMQEQEAILSEGRGANGRFQRPPDAAYGQRPVKTIDEEAVAPPKIISENGGAKHEEPADLDRTRCQREDD